MNGFNESEAYRLACGLDGKSWESKHIKTIYVNTCNNTYEFRSDRQPTHQCI